MREAQELQSTVMLSGLAEASPAAPPPSVAGASALQQPGVTAHRTSNGHSSGKDVPVNRGTPSRGRGSIVRFIEFVLPNPPSPPSVP